MANDKTYTERDVEMYARGYACFCSLNCNAVAGHFDTLPENERNRLIEDARGYLQEQGFTPSGKVE